MIGMWLAARAPGRIAALGLCCTSAHLPPASGWLARAEQVRSAGMASITDQSLGRWFTGPFGRACPATVAKHAATLEAVDSEGYAGCCAAIAAMDLRPLLGSITAPTLVIAGSEDPATPPAHGALIASQIHGARLQVIRGAAHLANVQAPGQVTAALLAADPEGGAVIENAEPDQPIRTLAELLTEQVARSPDAVAAVGITAAGGDGFGEHGGVWLPGQWRGTWRQSGLTM
jgi:3-oxoadipate enol-lactonase